MTDIGQVDEVETRIVTSTTAQELLSSLPSNDVKLDFWYKWTDVQFKNCGWLDELKEVVTICYARMALRNGHLNKCPRAYHNEWHISELLQRLIRCHQYAPNKITAEGWAILSVFAAAHDLRQAEPPKDNNDDSLVGANESASYYEIERLISRYSESELWNPHRLILLKTMIHASTFGIGGKRSTNFFQGNLSQTLLSQLHLSANDEELIYLACDIDTANVSLPLYQYALSAIRVYEELITHQKVQIPAHIFFSKAQIAYFFDQQQFHSKLGSAVFEKEKSDNAKHIKTIAKKIATMDSQFDPELVKDMFIEAAKL